VAVRYSAYAASVYAVCVCYSACNVEPSTKNTYVLVPARTAPPGVDPTTTTTTTTNISTSTTTTTNIVVAVVLQVLLLLQQQQNKTTTTTYQRRPSNQRDADTEFSLVPARVSARRLVAELKEVEVA